jgi:hypothetical protein
MSIPDQYRIRALSIMGWTVWITEIGEEIDDDKGGKTRIVSAVNRESKSRIFSREEAEAALPHVLKTHRKAEIVWVSNT